jgi:hypothetical protein
MAFDFDKTPIGLYGLFPDTPFPLDVSIYGDCQCSCVFCFANLNRAAHGHKANMQNSLPRADGQWMLSLAGTLSMVEAFGSFVRTIVSSRAKPHAGSGKCFVYELGGNLKVPSVLRLLYRGAGVSLDRKQLLANEAMRHVDKPYQFVAGRKALPQPESESKTADGD